jgi:hypothetical protein
VAECAEELGITDVVEYETTWLWCSYVDQHGCVYPASEYEKLAEQFLELKRKQAAQ